MATGIPDISISLFNLKVNDFNLPLSISYHSSGIKVDQVPGPVGYGWSLMPSFRISWTINNKADTHHLLDQTEIRMAESFRLSAGDNNIVNEDKL